MVYLYLRGTTDGVPVFEGVPLVVYLYFRGTTGGVLVF